MKNLIQQLIKQYNIEDIEYSAIRYFIESNNILKIKNKHLRQYLLLNNSNYSLIKEAYAKKITKLSISNLLTVFELLIPPEDRKLNGVFYTPDFITKFMSSECITSDNQKICDPSCGSGAFLLATSQYINKKFNKTFYRIFKENIYGVDICEYSVNRTILILSLLALSHGEDKYEFIFNIKSSDSLNTDWKELFPIINNGFDLVIGNPPYVKFQELPENLRKQLYTNWKTLKKGTYNLYFAFYELGVNLLNKNGVLCFITPNNYFTSLSGIHLREFLINNRLINRIIDFNHLKVFDAQTYTCITFLKRTNNNYFRFERIDERDKLTKLKELKYSKIKIDKLNNKKWRLLRECDQGNITKIESYSKLGNLFDIRVGIATCKDSIYFIESSKTNAGHFVKSYMDEQFLIEEEITKPTAKISDFKNQNELENNKRRIIFPYKFVNGSATIIPENELKEKYPLCHKYFIAVKKELCSRDKGKSDYPEWYAYARTQGLNFVGEKLLTPTFSAKPRFLFEKNSDTLFCNGYAIFSKNTEQESFFESSYDLKFLSKILNSLVMHYYIKATSISIEGGYPCYQKNFIELFGIPHFDQNEVEYIKNEKDKNLINELLIEKYQLSLQ